MDIVRAQGIVWCIWTVSVLCCRPTVIATVCALALAFRYVTSVVARTRVTLIGMW